MITHRFCKEGIMTQPICELVISMIGGFSRGEVDHVSYRRISENVILTRDLREIRNVYYTFSGASG